MRRLEEYKLVELANGAFSVHSVAHRETFHPVVGPVAEAEALYVRQLNLRQRLERRDGEFVIWDVGLGAAANALTVLRAAGDVPGELRLLSFDHTLEPLRFALANANRLGYFDGFEGVARRLAEGKGGPVEFAVKERKVIWELYLGDFPCLLGTKAAEGWAKPDAILFDAFSPAKNPAMWTLPLFSDLYRLLDPGRPCALPTYSRSTLLRVSLLLAGFYVGSGHATGEKEETTIAANDLGLIAAPLGAAWLKRAMHSTSAEPLMEPVYSQRRMADGTWERLRGHPQFEKALGKL